MIEDREYEVYRSGEAQLSVERIRPPSFEYGRMEAEYWHSDAHIKQTSWMQEVSIPEDF